MTSGYPSRATVYWNGFYMDISRETICNCKNKIWSLLCQILWCMKSLVDSKSMQCMEIAKRTTIWQGIHTSNLSSFLEFMFWYKIVCVKLIGLELARLFKKPKNDFILYFFYCNLVPLRCPPKTHVNTQCGLTSCWAFAFDPASSLVCSCLPVFQPTSHYTACYMMRGIEISNPTSWHEQTLSSRDFTLGK